MHLKLTVKSGSHRATLLQEVPLGWCVQTWLSSKISHDSNTKEYGGWMSFFIHIC